MWVTDNDYKERRMREPNLTHTLFLTPEHADKCQGDGEKGFHCLDW